MEFKSLKHIKLALDELTSKELIVIILRLIKFKKDNKELVSYLIFDAHQEDQYIARVKEQMDDDLKKMNMTSLYFAKKTIRKCLRTAQKYARFSSHKSTEVELLMHFCFRMRHMELDWESSRAMCNLYDRQIEKIQKLIKGLHEDLQYDYNQEMEKLELIF